MVFFLVRFAFSVISAVAKPLAGLLAVVLVADMAGVDVVQIVQEMLLSGVLA